MSEVNKKSSSLIPNPYALGESKAFEGFENNIYLTKIFKENKNLTTIAKTIKESKLFEGQISSSSRKDIIKMLENLTSEEIKYYYTLFLPNLDKTVKYYNFYYIEKLIHDKKIENENLCQKAEEEMDKDRDKDYDNFIGEYQNFSGDTNSLSQEDTKEGTDKNNEENKKIDGQKLKDIFLQSIKFYSKKSNLDSIISLDIKSLLLSNILEKKFFTKNKYFENWINPIYCENEWYLPLPKWVFSITKFDVFFQTLIIHFELVTLLLYEYYTLTGSILPKDNNIYIQYMNKISEYEKESNSIIEILNSNKQNNTNLHEKKKEKEKKDLEQISGKKSKKSSKKINLTLLKIIKYIKANNIILKPYKEKKIKEIKEYCKILLADSYDIKFLDYGSSTTGLELPTSDIDTLIYYIEKDKSKLVDKRVFGSNLYELLQIIKKKYNLQNLKIKKVLDASVPIIKLEYDITEEIDLNYRQVLIKEELTKVKIDISFTNEEDFYQTQEKVKQFIIEDLNKYTYLKSLVLIIKFILELKKLNNSHTGGLNSISVFFLAKHIVKIYEKEKLTLRQLLSKFLVKYSKYDFTYGIDIYGNSFAYTSNQIKRIFILNNFSNNNKYNFAYSCEYEEIIKCFIKIKNICS